MMNYPFRVYRTQVEEHIFWVAESASLKGCVGQGDSQEEAISELASNEAVWLETAAENGIEIPALPLEAMTVYSGKLTLRVAPSVHQEAAENARKQGISLNQYLNDAVVSQNARIQSVEYLAKEIRGFAQILQCPTHPQILRTRSGSSHSSNSNITVLRTDHDSSEHTYSFAD